MRLVQPFDVLVAVSSEPNLDFVLAIHRERVGDQGAAAGPDWQALDVLFLSEVRLNPDRLAARRAAGSPDGQPADFLRRRGSLCAACGGE